jgi:cytochrome c oxidase subunit 2
MPLLHSLSLQAHAMRLDWFVFLVVAFVVWVIVLGLIIFAAVKWREGKGNDEPAQFQNNPPIEIMSAVIPILMVTGLFIFSDRVESYVDALAAHPADTVDVTAFRWSWRFGYAGTPVIVTGTPVQPPTLYLPVGRVTRFELRSVDVTHSFWVPALLFKRDAIPGLINRFDITPTKVGTYLGRCAQFCGLDHADMTFAVKVVPDAAYDRYLASGGNEAP